MNSKSLIVLILLAIMSSTAYKFGPIAGVAAQDNLELSETISTTDKLGGTVTLNYPAGWTPQTGFDGLGVIVLSGPEEFQGLTITYLARTLAVSRGATPIEVLHTSYDAMVSELENGTDVEISDFLEIELGEYSAAKLNIVVQNSSRVYYVVAIGGSYVMAQAFNTDEALVEAIILSVRYSSDSEEEFVLTETASVTNHFGAIISFNYPVEWYVYPQRDDLFLLQAWPRGRMTIEHMGEPLISTLGNSPAEILESLLEERLEEDAPDSSEILETVLGERPTLTVMVHTDDYDVHYYLISVEGGYIFAVSSEIDTALVEAILLTIEVIPGEAELEPTATAVFGSGYTATVTDSLGGTILVNFPQAWSVQPPINGTGQFVFFANSGASGLVLTYIPEALASSLGETATEVLHSQYDSTIETLRSQGFGISDILEFQIGEYPAAKLTTTIVETDTDYYAVNMNGSYVTAIASGIDETLLQEVILTVQYEE